MNQAKIEKQRPKFVSNRTVKDGSFFILDGNSIQYSLENPVIKKMLGTLKPTYSNTLKAILTHGVENRDKQNCLGVSELASLASIPIKTFRAHLRELRDFNIFLPVEFEFADGSFHPKVIAETLNFDFEPPTTPIIEEIEPDNQSTNPLNEKKLRRKELLQNAFEQYDVQHMEQRVEKDNLPQVVRPRGEYIVDQLVSNKARPRGKQGLIARQKNFEAQRYDEQARTFVISTESGPKSFLAQIRSYTSVMDAKDLQVQFAIHSLIFNYHSYFSSKHGNQPRNLTPLYVDDIILMLGRQIGGKNRIYVRDCIQVIEDTEFNLLSLEKLKFQIDDTVISGFAKSNYKNFKTCIPITNTPPTTDPKSGRVILPTDAMTYLIALPDLIFENLIQNDSVFAFPPETLRMKVIMFALYLRFRSLVRDRVFSETLTNLKDKLQYDAPDSDSEKTEKERYNDFLDALKIEFRHLEKNAQDLLWAKLDGESIRFNLLGYHGEFDFKKGKYYVSCDLNEMLQCCRIEQHESKAISDASVAPVLYNGMSALFPDKIHKRLNVAINKVIKSEHLMFNMRYSTESSKNEVLVSKYATEEEIYRAALELEQMSFTKFDVMILQDKIQRDLDDLTGLKLGNHIVTRDEIDKLLCSGYLEMYINDIDPLNLFKYINRSRSVHKDLLEFFKDGIFSAKLMKFLDRYIETRFPEEDY